MTKQQNDRPKDERCALPEGHTGWLNCSTHNREIAGMLAVVAGVGRRPDHPTDTQQNGQTCVIELSRHNAEVKSAGECSDCHGRELRICDDPNCLCRQPATPAEAERSGCGDELNVGGKWIDCELAAGHAMPHRYTRKRLETTWRDPEIEPRAAQPPAAPSSHIDYAILSEQIARVVMNFAIAHDPLNLSPNVLTSRIYQALHEFAPLPTPPTDPAAQTEADERAFEEWWDARLPVGRRGSPLHKQAHKAWHGALRYLRNGGK